MSESASRSQEKELDSPLDGINEGDVGKVDGGFFGYDASRLIGAASCHVLFHLLAPKTTQD